MYYVIRSIDGLICSLPASYRIAEGVATYLAFVTDNRYDILCDGVRVSSIRR